jgi:parvulin-like peptidyl-prolyl isomerase
MPPTPTSPPAAALVNGVPILLSDYQAELERFHQARQETGTELATIGATDESVLNALIDLELLAQEAEQQGHSLSEEELSAHLDSLSQAAGASENAGAWMAAYGYDLDSLRRALRRELLAQMAVEELANQVPAEVEQVLARHILVADQERAEQLRQQIIDGADFGQLALEESLDLSSRVDGGNLGWFPQGVLTEPEIEQAAFELEVGEVSAVIKTELGYHLLEVLDREIRPLNPNDMRRLRQLAVESWLEQARQQATIERLVEF